MYLVLSLLRESISRDARFVSNNEIIQTGSLLDLDRMSELIYVRVMFAVYLGCVITIVV